MKSAIVKYKSLKSDSRWGEKETEFEKIVPLPIWVNDDKELKEYLQKIEASTNIKIISYKYK